MFQTANVLNLMALPESLVRMSPGNYELAISMMGRKHFAGKTFMALIYDPNKEYMVAAVFPDRTVFPLKDATCLSVSWGVESA